MPSAWAQHMQNTVLLGGRELGPILWWISDQGHLKIVSAVILGLELQNGATPYASNIKLLVDFLWATWFIKYSTVASKLPKYWFKLTLRDKLACASNIIQEMMEMSTRIVCNVVGIPYQNQHALVSSLVALNISSNGGVSMQPNITKILNGLLWFGGKCILCTEPKEGVIELPPHSEEFRMNVELIHVNLGFSPLHNALQFLEVAWIVLHSLAGVHNEGRAPSGGKIFLGLDNNSASLLLSKHSDGVRTQVFFHTKQAQDTQLMPQIWKKCCLIQLTHAAQFLKSQVGILS